jgi:hypothetical protein
MYKTYSNVDKNRAESDATNEYMPREPGMGKVRRLPRMRVRKRLDKGKGKEKAKEVSDLGQSSKSSV